MKGAILVMGLLLLLTVGLAWRGGMLEQGLRNAQGQLASIGPVLVLALVLAGMVEALIPKGFVEHWLSDAAGWRGIAVAWLGGLLTPGASITGLPMAAGLYRAGVGAPVLVTYLASLSVLSILRLPLELGILGPRLTLLRVLACALLPPIAGLITRAVQGLIPPTGG